MDNSTIYILISIGFVLITFSTLFFFYWSMRNAKSDQTRNNALKISVGLLGWLILQFYITISGIYSGSMDSVPPKIALFGILPTFALMIVSFSTKKGRNFIDSLPLREITYLNMIRIPVEIVLLLLAIFGTIPYVMTFEGLNFDILAGISAPFIAYFGFTKKKIKKSGLILWNVISLGLLITIIIVSILSAPSPFQYFEFVGDNFAIFEFPFSWLPTFVVPVVLFGHFVSIRQLIRSK